MNYNDILQSKFTEYSDSQFQSLFYEIMKSYYGDDFDSPRAYGNVGDFACDGYLRSDESFFACYGPENPSNNDITAKSINDKIDHDSTNLIKKIKDKTWTKPIKKFVFVVNLKLFIMPPSPVVRHLQEVEKKFNDGLGSNVSVVVHTQYDLSLLFAKLDPSIQKYIAEKVYAFEEDYSIDGSLIAHIIERYSKEDFRAVAPHDIMEFDSKIKFNNLSDENRAEIIRASYSAAEMEIFVQGFDVAGLDVLQSAIITLYNASTETYPDNSDAQYEYILKKLYEYDEKTTSETLRRKIRATCAIIVSRFFENCSIFKS